MNRKHPTGLTATTLFSALAAAIVLSACNRVEDDGRTAGQQVDSAAQRAETAAENARNDARQAGSEMRSETRAAATEASDKVADAAITASVNADLAKDSDLSALRINVDTHNGHVTLRGTAPSEDAKQRAAKMAANVRGVTSVSNELTVQP